MTPTAGAVLQLQRDAGNRAVTEEIETHRTARVAAPPRANTASVQLPLTQLVQRSPPTVATTASSTFSLPGELGFGKDLSVTTRDEAATALKLVALRLRTAKSDVDDEASGSLESGAKTLEKAAGEYAGSAGLTSHDVADLNGFVLATQLVLRGAYTGTAERLIAKLDAAAPAADDKTRMEVLEEDLAEAMHQKFLQGEKSGLDLLVETVAKVAELNKQVGEYAEKVKTWGKRLDAIKSAADAVAAAEKVKEFTDELGKQIGTVKKVADISRDIAVVLALGDTSNGTTMMKGVDEFAAGIDLLDKAVDKFAKGVPLFGDLWSKYYKPLVDACIKGLRKIAGLMEIKDREDVVGMWNVDQSGGRLERDANGAPLIPGLYLAKGDFPGGQAVFSYLWCLRGGKSPPAVSEEVHDFFYKQRNLVNALASGKDDELDYTFHLFSKNRLKNLDGWLAGHWAGVWSMLYGRFGRYVPY